MSKKLTKRKKKKKKSQINNINFSQNPIQESNQYISNNNDININQKNNIYNNENTNVHNNGIDMNEEKKGEIGQIKQSNRPFGNIKFNNRISNKNHNRNDISKGQLYMQKDQTDRSLLKSNS